MEAKISFQENFAISETSKIYVGQVVRERENLSLSAHKSIKNIPILIKSNCSVRNVFLAIRKAIQEVMKKKADIFSINSAEIYSFISDKISVYDFYSTLTTEAIVASYVYDRFKKAEKYIKKIVILDVDSENAKKGFNKGKNIGYSMNVARNLANDPAQYLGPEELAMEAENIFKVSNNVEVKILSESEARDEGLDLYLSVGEGSYRASKFIIIEYNNASSKQYEKPIVLIGKGVTFDSGGINLKPSTPGGIETMHMDMTGGAIVIGALLSVVRNNLKKNVIGIVPAVENAISSKATRPGDIVNSLSGSTVWVGNTDAEGRLILADAITYAKRYDPRYVIDIATLTGAALVALGEYGTAYFTDSEELSDLIQTAQKNTMSSLWRLPLWDEFGQNMENSLADISNISKVRWGGPSNAASFLKHFANDYDSSITKWVHLDIAPRMTSCAYDFLSVGATGEPVAMLTNFIEKV